MGVSEAPGSGHQAGVHGCPQLPYPSSHPVKDGHRWVQEDPLFLPVPPGGTQFPVLMLPDGARSITAAGVGMAMSYHGQGAPGHSRDEEDTRSCM